MKLKSESDVDQLLRAYLPAAALGTALELGLFWELEGDPKSASDIAEELDIPITRCQHWLDYLLELGLLEKADMLGRLSYDIGRILMVLMFLWGGYLLVLQFQRMHAQAAEEEAPRNPFAR